MVKVGQTIRQNKKGTDHSMANLCADILNLIKSCQIVIKLPLCPVMEGSYCHEFSSKHTVSPLALSINCSRQVLLIAFNLSATSVVNVRSPPVVLKQHFAS
uniref:Mannosyltransferase n=1 Tax=Oryza nivara TaxID=4536 RepID=A0A0E0FNI8_ORYNI